MSDNETLDQNLRNWLRKEGYPLEMQAASLFRMAGFRVRQGQHFPDPDTGKSREIDLQCLADDPLGVANFRLIVECKSSSKPWVVFTSAHVLDNYNRFVSFAMMSDAARHALVELNEADYPKDDRRVILEQLFATYGKLRGKGEVFDQLAWFKKDGRIGYTAAIAFSNSGNEIPYNATLSVLKAGLWEHRPDDTSYRPAIIVTFPLLVIDAPLFECYLDDTGEMQLENVNECEVLFFGTIGNSAPGACVRIVTLNGLADFARNAALEIEKLKTLLQPAMDREWKAVKDRTSFGKTEGTETT